MAAMSTNITFVNDCLNPPIRRNQNAMKLNTFIYIIVIFNQFVLYSQVDNDSLLEWNTRKLKIEDFKLEYDIPEEIERMELQYS